MIKLIAQGLIILSPFLFAGAAGHATRPQRPPIQGEPVSKNVTSLGLTQADLTLLHTMAELGITSLAQHDCKPGLQGQYYPDENVLLLCSNNPHTPDIGDTIRHEAIHAAQDCKAGQSNGDFTALQPERHASMADLQDHVAHSYGHLSPDVQALEVEAFALASQLSHGQVDSVLRSYCSTH